MNDELGNEQQMPLPAECKIAHLTHVSAVQLGKTRGLMFQFRELEDKPLTVVVPLLSGQAIIDALQELAVTRPGIFEES